jgi:hypothetical protein
VLRAADLEGAFEMVVAKQDVATAKPAPECYRLALALLLSRRPTRFALEESPTGLGLEPTPPACGCIAVGHRRPPATGPATRPYLPHLADVSAVLHALGL